MFVVVSFDVEQKFRFFWWSAIFHPEQSASINSEQKHSRTTAVATTKTITKTTTTMETTTIWLFNTIVWLKKNLFRAIAIIFDVCKSCARACVYLCVLPPAYIDMDESNHMKIAVLLYILLQFNGISFTITREICFYPFHRYLSSNFSRTFCLLWNAIFAVSSFVHQST